MLRTPPHAQVFLLAVALLSALGARAGDAGSVAARPLASRSGPRGATMFTALSPEATGLVVENRYADPRMWSDHHQEFKFGAIGTGVAIADYDNDGRPDVFVVSKTERSRLFRNLGHWRFQDVTDQAGLGAAASVWAQGLAWMKDKVGSETAAGESGADDPEHWRQGAAWADVNNDGWLDLYVCRFGAPNLLYINQGDGTFKEEAAARGLAVVDASGMAAFCDFDRDGWLDLYLQTNLLDAVAHPTGQRDYLFHNNRDGTFTDVTARAGIRGETQGHSVTWWDFDNDGWPDIYVANDFAPADSLYRNNRDGTFTDVLDRVVPHTPHSSMGSDLGDVNNDGLIDFLVADMAATSHVKDQRGMARNRALLRDHDTAPGLAPQYMRSALFLNTGTGRVLEAAQLAGLSATDWTWSVRFEDLDNDGRLDAFFTNGMVRELHNVDLVDRLAASESPHEEARILKDRPPFAESHLAFRNLGDLRFEPIGPAWGLDQKGVSFGAAFGDLDGDGDLDLIFANYQGGVTILRNDSDTGHRLVVALRGMRSNRFGVGATVRIATAAGPQVRTLVLARGCLSTSEPILHFGLGDDAVIRRLVVNWPSGQTQTLTNVAADQKLTLTEPDAPASPAPPEPPPPGLFEPVGERLGLALGWSRERSPEVNPQPLLAFRQNASSPAAAACDLNGDGIDDLVLGGTAADPARLLLGRAAQAFTVGALPPPAAASLNDGPVLLFDADGDGANDLLVTRGGAALPAGSAEYQPRLFLNDGHGALRVAPADTLPPLPISAGAAAAADFDRDGRLDLFIGGRRWPGRYPLAPRSALLVNRGGRFVDVTEELAPALRGIGMVTAALWTDVDGDGWPDLLLALEWGGVRYFHNQAGRGFEDRSDSAGFAAAGRGWWTSLAAADFNGDGRLDYVCGNLGLNTPYHATVAEPALLFYGSFEPGTSPQLVEGYYEGGRLYPRLGRNELGSRIPSVRRRFPRNDAYALATLPEILGEDRLAAAQRFAATEFRSGVFLSQPDGTWRFEPLPRLAQIAPLQGIAVGDFDGDGHTDIYAVQNSFAPLPSVGRFDGGLSQLLRGDGRGHFTPVPPAVSGLVVLGDAKALVALDLDGDGWADFFVTRADEPTLAFRNRGGPGGHPLRVTLRGPPGNPTAVGARVSVELADGSTQMVEVHAGSSLLSQSSAACFFGYPDSAPPRRIRVCWPTGEVTVVDPPAGVKMLSLPAPAR